jgi:hypothetical protein
MNTAHWKGNLAGAAIIALVIAALSFAAYRSADKVVKGTEVTGVLQGMFQAQSRQGRGVTLYYVRLSSGEIVQVKAPVSDTFRKDARVVLVRNETEQDGVVYSFGRYDR